jgi:UvrD/REP helicase.
LWTQKGHGEPIRIYRAMDEREEAEFICREIQSIINNKNKTQGILLFCIG